MYPKFMSKLPYQFPRRFSNKKKFWPKTRAYPSNLSRVCGSGFVPDLILEHASRDPCVSTAVELRRWSDWTKRCQIQMRGGNKKLILTWWRHKSSSARLYHTEITRITTNLQFWTAYCTDGLITARIKIRVSES